MWKGQFNAILGLLLLGSCVASAATETPELMGSGFGLVILLWVAGWIANMVSSALFGFPLLYSKKHMTKRTDDGSVTRES